MIETGRDKFGPYVLFEGRKVWCDLASRSVEALRASAERWEKEATEKAYFARRCAALADHKEAETVAREAVKRTERNRKAAATRAKNKDPFGFGALTAPNG